MPSGEVEIKVGEKRPANSLVRMLAWAWVSDAVACVSGAVGSNQSRIKKVLRNMSGEGRGILAEGMLRLLVAKDMIV